MSVICAPSPSTLMAWSLCLIAGPFTWSPLAKNACKSKYLFLYGSPTFDGRFGSYSPHLSARCCPRSAGPGPPPWSASSSSSSAAWVVAAVAAVVVAVVAPPPHFAAPFAQPQTLDPGQPGSVARDGLL